MHNVRYFLAVMVVLSMGSLACAQNAGHAEAVLKPTQGNQASGTIQFQESGGMVHVTGTISGARTGNHGFHIHEKGDCSAPDGTSTGGHFNPTGKAHGAPDAAEHHVGDLGNVTANANGDIKVDMKLSGVSLEGPNSIVGKGVILHGAEDDMKTQPTGNAGARIACGVIEKK